MGHLIDGKAIAAGLRQQLRSQVDQLRHRGVVPALIAFFVGEDPTAEMYFKAKRALAQELGVTFYGRRLAQISEDDLILQIESCNQNSELDGIFVELPLPAYIDAQRVRRAVDPDKDVDGINPINLGKLVVGEEGMLPATPVGALELMRRAGVDFEGAEAVVVGRSEVVGIPLALLLMREHATVTICHSRTQDLAEKTRRAQILCVAAGVPGLIRADMVRQGAVVVDIGVNVTSKGIVGDVAFEEVAPVAGWITPVPGGVGPMTSTMVMANVIRAAQRRVS